MNAPIDVGNGRLCPACGDMLGYLDRLSPPAFVVRGKYVRCAQTWLLTFARDTKAVAIRLELGDLIGAMELT